MRSAPKLQENVVKVGGTFDRWITDCFCCLALVVCCLAVGLPRYLVGIDPPAVIALLGEDEMASCAQPILDYAKSGHHLVRDYGG